MRISFQQFFRTNANNILSNQAAAQTTSGKIATGKEINSPSDNPTAAAQLLQFEQQISNSEQFLVNADYAEGRLEQSEILVADAVDSLTKIRSLTLQANNGHQSRNELNAISQEIEGVLDRLATIANTRDADGDYLFAGFQSKQQPFSKNASGDYIYNGDDGERFSEVAEGFKIQTSDSGFDVFDNIRRGNGTFYITGNNANTGGASITEQTVTDPSIWVPDDYTVTFSSTGTPPVTEYEITDSGGTVVVPSTTYVSDQAITFNGISFKLEGETEDEEPQAGDVYTVSAANSQSVFKIVENVLDTIDNKTQGVAANARFANDLALALTEIDSALNNLNGVRTQIGSRLNQVEDTRVLNEAIIFQTKVTKSSIEDLNLPEAITDLQQQTALIDAAQTAFLRTASVFNIFDQL